jgi:superfamily II DNA or RNA helicase
MELSFELSFRELDLKEQYRSDKDNLLKDFYHPCLQRSDSYWRAVGYFTSSSLAHAAQGLVGLILRNGRMKLVASPWFTAEDIAKINEGYRLREIIERSTIRELENLEKEQIRIRVRNLAWLISQDLLEIKVAVVDDPNQKGIYHEKVGIFQSGDDIIAFTGSPNETEGGLISNFECIDVYTSWNDPERVRLKVQAFQELWSDRTHNLKVYDFPEAAKGVLVSYSPREKPRTELGMEELSSTWFSPAGMQPYEFQEKAIKKWENANYQGILEMATGTGKTFTALTGISPLVDKGHSFLIVVPRRLLARQWDQQIKKHYPRALTLVCTSLHDWRKEIEHYLDISLERINNPDLHQPVFFIVTFQTAHTRGFRNKILPTMRESKFGIIIDEVHWAGADTFSKVFEFEVPVRLGLSATPERYFDPEGTDLIFQYFGGKPIYKYGIKKAIKSGFLTEYEYHVRLVELEVGEYLRYQELSKQIAQAIARTGFEEDENQHLTALLAKRANIIKSAISKMGFLEWVHSEHQPQRCLVYCTNLDHLRSTASLLTELGSLVGQYHSEMNDESRNHVLSVFEAGHLDYLVSIKCLDEGVDIPECNSAIILSSSTNSREFIQRRGRVLRRSEGKTRAFIFDPFVVPSREVSFSLLTDRAAKKILGSELKRVEEFGENAENSEQILRFVKLVRARYGLN